MKKKIPILTLNPDLTTRDEFESILEFRNLFSVAKFQKYRLDYLKFGKIFLCKKNLIISKEMYKGIDYKYKYTSQAIRKIERAKGIIRTKRELILLQKERKQDERGIIILDNKFNILEVYKGSVKSLSIRDNVGYSNMKTKLLRAKGRLRNFLNCTRLMSIDKCYIYKKDYHLIMIEEEMRIKRVENARIQYKQLKELKQINK